MDYNRRYKCKYCDYKGNREQLVAHIEDKHSEYVTDEYPASRIVYNYLNNVSCGHCIICNKPTKWNDKTWKYKRLCDDPKCREVVKNTYRKNAIAAKGKYNFTDDPEHLEKMLANRKISGTYVCRDGSKKTYTGSYEKNTIEFMDKVLQCDPNDIMMPGPIFEYEYNGQTHKWITDIFYIPYNLVIEVKDGGANPNNRSMVEYREKQLAKEKAIIDNGSYNYLRLTDNDFSQLLKMFTALRLAMINDEDKARKAIIQINEDALDDIGSEVICTSAPDFALLFVYDDEVTEEVSYIGLTDLSSNYALIPTMEGELVSVNKFDLPNRTVSERLLKFDKKGLNKILEGFKYKSQIFDKYTICEMLTGKDFINHTDIALMESAGILFNDGLETQTFSGYVSNALNYEDSMSLRSYIGLDESTTEKLVSHDNIRLVESVDGYRLESIGVYPILSTKVGSLENTISMIEGFSYLVSKYGGRCNGR